MQLSYSSTRSRRIGPAPAAVSVSRGGQQQLNMNLSFRPTAKWQVAWTTSYDFDTQQFAEHYVRLERDLHRWHASFQFVKSPNGNLGFSFYVSLLDQPDIKFDYDQRTFVRP